MLLTLSLGTAHPARVHGASDAHDGALTAGSEAKIEWGAYAFVASAIGSMLVPLLSEKQKK